MPTQAQVPEVIDAVREKLGRAAAQGVKLKVAGERLEDDWLYIVIAPDEADTRASDHAAWMAKIEKELRESGFTRVLLVPAIED